MIFTDQKINTPEVKIRFYFYKDWEKCYGDAGTKMYAIFPLSAFIEKENKKLNKGSYFTYDFTKEWDGKLDVIFEDYWRMSFGYELADEAKRMAEIEKATNIIEIAKTFKNFSSAS
jgi:hypothetical protein